MGVNVLPSIIVSLLLYFTSVFRNTKQELRIDFVACLKELENNDRLLLYFLLLALKISPTHSQFNMGQYENKPVSQWE